ncbi:MAG TPA: hypothetical protein EYG70_08185 [Sulfurimonas sp.]|nr:hypothetical protein [Sulfurimonas sp.]
MEVFNVKLAIKDFMHPTLYTGVKPLFLVAEELVTDKSVGHVAEAVWVGLNAEEEFTYISKFAVSGKIILGKYYSAAEKEPFKERLALTNETNLENVVLHRSMVAQIKELETKRSAILQEIQKDFNALRDLYLENKEIYLFEKKNGQWDRELFSDFNINAPYKVISVQNNNNELHLHLKKSKTSKTIKYVNSKKFYAYFIGSLAELSGLKLKNESYLASINSLTTSAKETIQKIEWLDLKDPSLQNILQKLPKHPFEEYFHYIKKEDVRKIVVDEVLLDTLKQIILKHLPKNDNPLGMEYIPIDNLLFIFHMIIPREQALKALEVCDVVYEPPAIVLGFSGEHQMPPKYLVPITHVADAYKQFPDFMSVCKNFQNENS